MALSKADWTTYLASEAAARTSSSVSGDETTAITALAAEIKLLGGSPTQLLLEAFAVEARDDAAMQLKLNVNRMR